MTNHVQLIRKKVFDNRSHLSTQRNSLNELIELLYQVFSINEANIDYVYTIINNYKGTIKEWSSFIKFQ